MDPRTARMLAEHEQAATSAPRPSKGLARLNRDVNAWVRAHKLVAIVVSIAAMVILFYAYYRLVAVPAQLREQAEREVRAVSELKMQNAARQASLDTCLATVKADADTHWNSQCRVRRRGAGCALPDRVADRLDRDEGQGRNACLMQFSIAMQ